MQHISRYSVMALLVCMGGLILFSSARGQGGDRNAPCIANAKQVATGVALYVQDYDEDFPPMDTTPHFEAVVYPYTHSSTVFVCPVIHHDYLPNKALSLKSRASIPQDNSQIMVVQDVKRHPDGKFTVAFLDGHIERGGVIVTDPNVDCVNDAHRLVTGMLFYSQDYEALPPMTSYQAFQQALSPYVGGSLFFTCPQTHLPYKLNTALSGQSPNQYAQPDLVEVLRDPQAHDDGKITIAYLSGRVERRNTYFDLNGDSKADLLWLKTQTGELIGWTMNGTQPAGNPLAIAQSVPASWHVAGVLDLDNDGNLDILWQNRTTGDLYYWRMNGAKMVSKGYLNHAPLSSPDWKIVGTGDLNGDGNTDLIWQNQKTGDVYYWLLNGLKKVGEGYLALHPQADWWVVGVADLNGDGHPDLLWQNRTTGAVYYWLMNGTLKAFGDTLPVSAGPDWRLLGASHLNSMGKLDLLWRNQKTGDLTYTQMNGIQAESSGTIANHVPLDWELSGM